jgi:hypothetical protein
MLIQQLGVERTKGFFVCWAFCHNPSQIPQLVYLTLADRHADPRLTLKSNSPDLSTMKQDHTFMVLIHMDSIEDLTFYHYPADQLLVEGRVQFKEFHWHPGNPDGAMEEDIRVVQRYCCTPRDVEHRRRDNDEEDRGRGCSRRREFLGEFLDGLKANAAEARLTVVSMAVGTWVTPPATEV